MVIDYYRCVYWYIFWYPNENGNDSWHFNSIYAGIDYISGSDSWTSDGRSVDPDWKNSWKFWGMVSIDISYRNWREENSNPLENSPIEFKEFLESISYKSIPLNTIITLISRCDQNSISKLKFNPPPSYLIKFEKKNSKKNQFLRLTWKHVPQL